MLGWVMDITLKICNKTDIKTWDISEKGLTQATEVDNSHSPVPKAVYRNWCSWIPAARNTSKE